jgi:hypothetical protein
MILCCRNMGMRKKCIDEGRLGRKGLKRLWKMHTLEMILCCVDSLEKHACIHSSLWCLEYGG